MSSSEAQKSGVHETTADDATTGAITPHPGKPHPNMPKVDNEKVSIKSLPPDTEIIRDETDAGGPLVIKSNDPDLNPPKVPQDDFPTERTPEIDPPV